MKVLKPFKIHTKIWLHKVCNLKRTKTHHNFIIFLAGNRFVLHQSIEIVDFVPSQIQQIVLGPWISALHKDARGHMSISFSTHHNFTKFILVILHNQFSQLLISQIIKHVCFRRKFIALFRLDGLAGNWFWVLEVFTFEQFKIGWTQIIENNRLLITFHANYVTHFIFIFTFLLFQALFHNSQARFPHFSPGRLRKTHQNTQINQCQ